MKHKAVISAISKKVFLSVIAFASGIFITDAQGLINNGARIVMTNGAFIYINGGAGLGNFTNQDAGAFTGIVENQGTMDVTGDWNNLSAGNVFNANTGTVRLLGNNQFIQGTATTFFNNLTLGGGGIKTLNIPTLTGGGFAAPAGVLTLATLPLDLNGYMLTVNNPAIGAITHTTGYIISETPAPINPSIVQWNMGATNGIYEYPFGVSGTQIPFTLNKTAGIGNVSVSTRATALSNNTSWQASVTNMYSTVIGGPGEVPVVIDRWWDVDPSSPVTGIMSFTYRGVENTTTYNPTGTFSAQNWNGLQWLPPVGAGPGVVAGTAVVITPSQVLSTTPWVLSNLDAPLPIELLEFVATCDANEQMTLEWTTASEKQNDFFTIEKSNDGKSFDFLARIPSAGNGPKIRHYTYTDQEPFKDLTFYRLYQTDINGQTEYFEPIWQKGCMSQPASTLNVWSSGNYIHIFAMSPDEKVYNTSLYDMAGRLVWNESTFISTGVSEKQISTEKISKGIYMLTLSNNKEQLNYKILVGE